MNKKNIFIISSLFLFSGLFVCSGQTNSQDFNYLLNDKINNLISGVNDNFSNKKVMFERLVKLVNFFTDSFEDNLKLKPYQIRRLNKEITLLEDYFKKNCDSSNYYTQALSLIYFLNNFINNFVSRDDSRTTLIFDNVYHKPLEMLKNNKFKSSILTLGVASTAFFLRLKRKSLSEKKGLLARQLNKRYAFRQPKKELKLSSTGKNILNGKGGNGQLRRLYGDDESNSQIL